LLLSLDIPQPNSFQCFHIHTIQIRHQSKCFLTSKILKIRITFEDGFYFSGFSWLLPMKLGPISWRNISSPFFPVKRNWIIVCGSLAVIKFLVGLKRVNVLEINMK